MSENSKKKLLQRILIVTSSLAFLGFMVFPIAGLFNQSSQQSQSPAPSNPNNVARQLQTQEQGYSEAYKREPNNPFVLQKLIETRIQLYQLTGKIEALEGTVEPLEKLIQITPPKEQKELKNLRDFIKQTVAQQKQGIQTPPKPNSP